MAVHWRRRYLNSLQRVTVLWASSWQAKAACGLEKMPQMPKLILHSFQRTHSGIWMSLVSHGISLWATPGHNQVVLHSFQLLLQIVCLWSNASLVALLKDGKDIVRHCLAVVKNWISNCCHRFTNYYQYYDHGWCNPPVASECLRRLTKHMSSFYEAYGTGIWIWRASEELWPPDS